MKSKLLKTKKYKNLCAIFTLYGLCLPGTILTGKQWKRALIFEIGNNFDKIFEVVK